LVEARRPVLISDAPFQLLLNWRLSEICKHDERLLAPPRELLTATASEQLDAWLRQASCDLVLLIDSPGFVDNMPFPGFDAARLRAWLASSGKFVLTSQRDFQAYGTATAQIWRLYPLRPIRAGGGQALAGAESRPARNP
jgi:hypothetical protein